MTLTGKLAATIMKEDPKERVIKREEKSEMSTTWQKIKNGIKRAITFVIDVLLLIPRAIFHGICNEITYIACKYFINEGNCTDDDEYVFVDEEEPEVVIETEEVSAEAETSLTKKELRKQAREERKASRKEAKESRKEEKRESKSAAKEEVKAETTTEVIEEAKAEDTQVVEEAETTTEVIEEAKAEDTQVVEEAEEKVVAAGDSTPAVAIVPTVENVTGEVVSTTPAEVVESSNASNTTDTNANEVVESVATDSTNCEHHHPVMHEHICELRKDDIGYNEVIALDQYCKLMGDNTAYYPEKNFVHADKFMQYTTTSARALVTAWCERLGVPTNTMAESPDKYRHLINELECLSEISGEEKGVLESRACNFLCMNCIEANRLVNIYYTILAKYFKKFYGNWVIYKDFNDELIKARAYFSTGQLSPRLSDDEAIKYFPIDESLKGINMEAPFVLGDIEKQR